MNTDKNTAAKGAEQTESSRVLAPIIVGVIGKRDLSGREDWVRCAIRRAFDMLDARFELSPKLMLSGLAEGTDRIAASEARRREGWTLVAVLPFEPDLYSQDFDASGVEWLRECVGDAGVLVHILPTLTEPGTDSPFSDSSIARTGKASNPNRSPHYEQLGLYIANVANIFIAVMAEDETPDKIGGTARIVNYRVHGILDARGRDVVERSQVLPPPQVIGIGHAGACWLVDLQRFETASSESRRGTFEVPTVLGGGGDGDRLEASLGLAKAIERFNRLALAGSARRAVGRDQRPASATLALRGVREEIASIQRRLKKRVQLAVWLLTSSFTVAVTSWEIFIERSEISLGWLGIFAYVAAFVIAVGTYATIRSRGWQSIMEDYRSVAEALRVQIAWWEAGLWSRNHSVDQYYLCRAKGPLGRIREAISALTYAARLQAPLIGPVPGSEVKWIDGQIAFFSKRILQREKILLASEVVSWMLFLGSFGIAVFLLVLNTPLRKWVEFARSWLDRHAFAGSAGLAILVIVAGLCAAAKTKPEIAARRFARLRPSAGNTASVAAAMLGFVAAFALFDFHARMSGADVAWMGIMSVVAAAIGGAIRFASEKLSLEAELRGYEDTLEAFEGAKKALAELDAASLTDRQRETMRVEILFALGKEALAESGAWLRAHKERPLEPMVGS
jgi:hypothetical protein